MDTLLLSGVAQRHREKLDRNPEAIFDCAVDKKIFPCRPLQMHVSYGISSATQPNYNHILIMDTRIGRHSNAAFSAHVLQDGCPLNEAEFEAFVQQFPIDDSISECFAFSPESENRSPLPKFVTGAKRPQISKYSKLKKKLGWGSSEENLNMADELTSRETKRSKKGGGVQSKRHKWRTPKEKNVNFSDISEFDTIGEFSGAASVRKSNSHKQTNSNMAHHESLSGSSSQSHSNISGHVIGADDVFETASSEKDIVVYEGPDVPIVPPRLFSSRVPDYVNVGSVRKDDCFSSILVQDTVALMKNLEELPVDVAMESRDERGNTLLHRCVELGSTDGVYMILDRFPALSSDMNGENMTAIEMSVKLGQVGCLKVMLDRNLKHKALGTPLLNRLLNISGSNGQSECLQLLLSYIPSDQHSNNTLPGDARGNTAAHVSAKNGHLKCLQTLVTTGYDVTSENLIHQRPLQVAHQNSRDACFAYLMLLDVCEKLLSNNVMQASLTSVLRLQTTSVKSSIEQLMSYLSRYQQLIAEAKESLVENRESILETLVNIHEDLIIVTEKAGNECPEKQSDIRDKLDELAGEIERLEDTFEFSPIEDLDTILSRVAQSLGDAISDITTVPEAAMGDTISEEQLKTALAKLLKDVHDDAIAENWDTKQKVKDIVGRIVETNSTLKTNSHKQVKHNRDAREQKPSLNNAHSLSGSDVVKAKDSTHETFPISATDATLKEPSDTKPDAIKANGNEDSISALPNREKSLKQSSESKLTWARLGQKQQHKPSVSVCTDRKTEHNMDSPHVTREGVSSTKEMLSEEDAIPQSCPVDNNSIKTKSSETEQLDIRKLSLDERMDILIAGERAREKLEDAEYLNTGSDKAADSSVHKRTKCSALSPTGTDSICTTTTFTSITSDSSDFSPDFQYELNKRLKRTDKSSFNSSSTEDNAGANLVPMTMDSTDSVTSVDLFTLTSDSTSYWWDVEDEDVENMPADYRPHDSSNSLQHLHENNASDQELRRQRVLQHVRALQRTRFPSNQFAEKITTSTGETMGGFEYAIERHEPNTSGRNERNDNRIVIDVDSALKAREGFKPIPMPRKKKKIPVSDSEDSGDTQSTLQDDIYRNFGARDQDLSSLDVHWEEMYISDDDVTVNGKAWYEMSDDDDVSLVPSWQSDDDTEGSRTPREI